jgi:hypothetical protein
MLYQVAQQIKRADLEKRLPADVKRITPEGRREQLESRRRGINHRFKWA